MSGDSEKTAFLELARASFADGTFRKLTLGKYRGGADERKCVAAPVVLRDVPHIRFLTTKGVQDITENDRADAAIERLSGLIGGDYLSAVLFTAREDVSLVYSRKRVGRLTRAKPTLIEALPTEHNRQKAYLVDPHAPYLGHLGVTQADGQVKPSMYAKFRQICRFVEILDQLLAGSELKDTPALRVVDVGSGKGYLTFALHEHLVRRLGRAPLTRGIEANTGLTETCSAIARRCDMAGLTFSAQRAENQAPGPLDILIALHACDTATDDAIHLGITGKAAIIVCAPCCQHELASQLETRSSPLSGLMKFGLLKQRQADLVTDAARALLLEAHGYEVRIIEFVSTEHTSKNLMIAAVRSSAVDRRAAADQYAQLAAFAGFKHQRLKDAIDQQRRAQSRQRIAPRAAWKTVQYGCACCTLRPQSLRDQAETAEDDNGVQDPCVLVDRQPAGQPFGDEGTRGGRHADHQRHHPGSDRQRAERLERADLGEPRQHRDRGVGGDHARPPQSGPHKHRQQDDAGTRGTARDQAITGARRHQLSALQLAFERLQPAPQRHQQCQHAADQDQRAAASEQREAPGAEHRRR